MFRVRASPAPAPPRAANVATYIIRHQCAPRTFSRAADRRCSRLRASFTLSLHRCRRLYTHGRAFSNHVYVVQFGFFLKPAARFVRHINNYELKICPFVHVCNDMLSILFDILPRFACTFVRDTCCFVTDHQEWTNKRILIKNNQIPQATHEI